MIDSFTYMWECIAKADEKKETEVIVQFDANVELELYKRVLKRYGLHAEIMGNGLKIRL